MRDHTISSVFHIHSLFGHLAKVDLAEHVHNLGTRLWWWAQIFFVLLTQIWLNDYFQHCCVYMSSVTLASVCYQMHIMNSSFQDCNSLCFTNFVSPATFWSSSISTESSWNSSYGMVFAHGVRSTESTKGNIILNLNFLRWLNHTN